MATDQWGNPLWGGANFDDGTTSTGGATGGVSDSTSWGIASSQINAVDKQGQKRLIQMADGTFVSGNLVKFNADGSVTDAGTRALFSPNCYLPGKPSASATVMAVEVPTNISSVQFSANFINSVGKCGTNPTATATYTVKVNGSSIGTFSISTSGVFTFSTSGGTAQPVAAGAEITVIAPGSQDATLSDVRFMLYGTR